MKLLRRSVHLSDSDQPEDLADLYENAPCGYLSLSPAARIVKVNQTLIAWLGISAETLLDEPLHKILSFGSKIAYETHLAPMLQMHGAFDEVALNLLNSSDEKIPVFANATIKRGPDGKHLFTRLTVIKAVERRSFERALIESKTKAEEQARIRKMAIQVRDQFVAVLGHDLRNPLAAITAGINLISRKENSEERKEYILSEMAKSVNRADKLIDDVLDLARGKLGGGFAIEVEKKHELRPVLEQVVNEMRAIYPDRELIFDCSEDLTADCDPDRIAQLVSNLMANAISHGFADQPICLTAKASQRELKLSVSNCGKKILDRVLKDLFQPFVRGQTEGNKKGLGLGLFIVNEIAKAHGGKMDVMSSKAETSFILTMPRHVSVRSG